MGDTEANKQIVRDFMHDGMFGAGPEAALRQILLANVQAARSAARRRREGFLTFAFATGRAPASSSAQTHGR
jgi:hypothetical protein